MWQGVPLAIGRHRKRGSRHVRGGAKGDNGENAFQVWQPACAGKQQENLLGEHANAQTRKTRSNAPNRIGKVRLAAMIEEATVDAYGESEQTTGWYTMLEEHLALPFDTTVLGAVVKVVRLDLRGENDIVAICARGRKRQSVRILDLPLPSPRPAGAEWIEAYRQWLKG